MSLTLVSLLGTLVAVVLACRRLTPWRSAFVLLFSVGVWLLFNYSRLF